MFEKKQKVKLTMEKPELTVEEMEQELLLHLPNAIEVGAPQPEILEQERSLVLEDSDFLQIETELVNAPSMFRSEDVLHRQRDPRCIRTSAKKAARKEAAALQEERDNMRARVINGEILSMRTSNGIDADTLVRRSVLEAELTTYQNLPARQDVTGHDRRANEAHYARAKKVTKGMEDAAKRDVDNLVNNLRRDLALDGSDVLPDDLQQYADSYYFCYMHGEKAIQSRRKQLTKAIDEGTITDKEKQEQKGEIEKLEQFVLFQKFYGSNAAPAMRTELQSIRARKLALQQIKDEGSSLYHQQMASLLEKEIHEMTVKYSYKILMMRTCNDTMYSNRTQMQLNTMQQLVDLRRRMKAPNVTNEKKEDLNKDAERIYAGYTYEGPVDKYENKPKPAHGAAIIQ